MPKFSIINEKLVNIYPWSDYLSEDLDYKILSSLEMWRTNPKVDRFRSKSYSKYRYDKLLADVSSLLNNCLAYRREYLDLQAAAIRQLLEYDLYKDQLETIKKLERADWISKVRDKEEVSQRAAAAAFHVDVGSPLSAGFEMVAEGAAETAKLSAQFEREREELVNSRWVHFDKYQKSLQDRHSTSGNPLNFKERAERIFKLLESDLWEAATKADVAREGLTEMTGIKTGPLWDDAKPLDSFVHWCREVLLDYEILSQFDARSESIEVFRFICRGNQDSSRVISYDLPNCRLKGIAVSFFLIFDEEIKNPYSASMDFLITAPNGYVVTINGAGLLQPNIAPLFIHDPAIINTPVNGPWHIKLLRIRNTFGTHIESQDREVFINVHIRYNYSRNLPQ